MQLGTKVPLWGGFSVHGGFTLKLWTPTSKMNKEVWKGYVPELKKAAAQANNSHNLSCSIRVWQNVVVIGDMLYSFQFLLRVCVFVFVVVLLH